jgi:hypothetical protein
MKMFLISLFSFIAGAVVATTAIWFFNPPLPPSITNTWGTFPKPPRTEWLPDGRKMKLLEDFVYVDPRKRAWVAPKDAEVDGASIPAPFWSFIGGPFEDKYRNASIVHDVECASMKSDWEDVHYMFYEACRCGGLGETKAKSVYVAVYRYGPRWAKETRTFTMMRTGPGGVRHPEAVTETISVPIHVAPPDAATLARLKDYVESKNPSIEELKTLDPATLQ